MSDTATAAKRLRTDNDDATRKFMCIDYGYAKTFIASYAKAGYTLNKLHERFLLRIDDVRGAYIEETVQAGSSCVRHVIQAPHPNRHDLTQDIVVLEYTRIDGTPCEEQLANLFDQQIRARVAQDTECAVRKIAMGELCVDDVAPAQ